jgi:hypothetical protein
LFSNISAAEDDVCYYIEYFPEIKPIGSGHVRWEGSVACSREVLTDKDFNVLAVFIENYPPNVCLVQLQRYSVQYDWVKLPELETPILLPRSGKLTSQFRGNATVYASVSWTDYEKFRAEHKVDLGGWLPFQTQDGAPSTLIELP